MKPSIPSLFILGLFSWLLLTSNRVPYWANTTHSTLTYLDTPDVRQIVSDYIDSIGGVEKLSKIKYLTLKTGVTVKGDSVEIYGMVYKKAPNKFSMITRSKNGTLVQKQIYNGRRGIAANIQETIELTETALADLEAESTMFPEMRYEELGYELRFLDFDTILFNGYDTSYMRPAYKLEVIAPSGSVEHHYYDPVSKLRIRTTESHMIQKDTVEYIIDYDNYTLINGRMRYPLFMNQQVDGQTVIVLIMAIDNVSKIPNKTFSVK